MEKFVSESLVLFKEENAIDWYLAERVIPDLIPETTRETTRNWFYKIAIIRELVPRILVEAAILKCYSFLSTEYD